MGTRRVRLATIKPAELVTWLAQSVSGPDDELELHVLAQRWELRCGDAQPFAIEWDGPER